MSRTYRVWYLLVLLVALAPAGARLALWQRVRSIPVDTEMARAGEVLFHHEWKADGKDELCAAGDGLGPVFNANSCVACHNSPIAGGAGGSGANGGNGFALITNDGSLTKPGDAYAAVGSLNRTPLRLATSGGDTSGLAVEAGRSWSAHGQIRVLISNYENPAADQGPFPPFIVDNVFAIPGVGTFTLLPRRSVTYADNAGYDLTVEGLAPWRRYTVERYRLDDGHDHVRPAVGVDTQGTLDLVVVASVDHGGGPAGEACRDALKMSWQLGAGELTAVCLETLAGVAGALHQSVLAARLLGAAEALRETTATPLPQVARSQYGRIVETARSQVDEATWQASWREGRAMRPAEAVEYALRTS